MHGPGPVTATNPPGWEPVYERPVRVVDTFALALPNQDHRRKWRDIREAGFAMWGIPFDIREYPVDRYTEFEVITGAIHIVRGASGNDSGGWIADPGGGLMVLGPWRPWWRRSWARSAAAVVCHESGHCLGLWHREDHGIMAGGRRPDDHDLKSIRDYYL